MSLLTKEQLEQIAQHFELKTKDTIQIKDGPITIHQKCWWRGSDGPQYVSMDENGNWHNAKNYPHLYSFKKPPGHWTYEE